MSRVSLTREEEADQALRHTNVTPGVACCLSIILIFLIVIVPIRQFLIDAQEKRRPDVLNVSLLRPADSASRSSLKQRLLGWLPTTESVHTYEDGIVSNSFLTQTTLPLTHQVLTSLFGVGNHQVVLGKQGHLFYFPEVEYVLGKPLPRSGGELAFVHYATQIRDMLQANGIDFIVMPIPPSTVCNTRYLIPQSAGKATASDSTPYVAQHPEWEAVKAALAQKGIKCFDPSPYLVKDAAHSAEEETDRNRLWIRTDTHWTPTGMTAAAGALAAFVQKNVSLPPVQPLGLRKDPPRTILYQNGDLVKMLHLPLSDTRYRKEILFPEEIHRRDGQLYEIVDKGNTKQAADVLIVGDSLTDIFDINHVPGVRASGLPEHLAFYLQRPVDCITDPEKKERLPMNYAARIFTSDPSRLCGKKVVILEFNARELANEWPTPTFPGPVCQ